MQCGSGLESLTTACSWSVACGQGDSTGFVLCACVEVLCWFSLWIWLSGKVHKMISKRHADFKENRGYDLKDMF